MITTRSRTPALDIATERQLDRDFFEKLAAAVAQPASIEDINTGLRPAWQVAAAERLLARGLIAEQGRDKRSGAMRYVVTDAGRKALRRG